MVKVTQFLLPNGKRQESYIKLPDGYEKKAQKIQEDGYAFELEILTTGQLSFSIASSTKDEAIEICNPGSGSMKAFKKLIDEFLGE